MEREFIRWIGPLCDALNQLQHERDPERRLVRCERAERASRHIERAINAMCRAHNAAASVRARAPDLEAVASGSVNRFEAGRCSTASTSMARAHQRARRKCVATSQHLT